MISYIVPHINSILHHLASKRLNIHFQVRKLKVGLRNLKAIFLLFGKLGNAANLNAADRKMLLETVSRTLPLDGKLKELITLLKGFDKDAGNLKKLLEAASTKYYRGEGRERFLKEVREAGEDINLLKAQLGGAIISVGLMIVPEVYSWCVMLDDKWHAKMSNRTARGLTVDDVAGFAGLILENLADFGAMASASQSLHLIEVQGAGEAIDAFEVQVKFLKDFLLFAKETGVDQKQLQNLLICIHSFTVDAPRALIMHRLEGSHGNWIEEVQARCLSLSAMATDPRVCEAYTQALSTSKPALDMNDDVINILKSFVDSLISLLWDILRGSGCKNDDQQEVLLYERLRISRTILKQPPQSFDGNKIGGLIRDAGIFICSVHQTGVDTSDPGRLSELLQRFDAFQAEYQIIPEAKKELSVGDVTNSMEDAKLFDGNEEDLKVQKEAATTSISLKKSLLRLDSKVMS